MDKSNILAILFSLLGLIYIIHAGINLPTNIDEWLYSNKSIIFLITGSLFLLITIIHLQVDVKVKEDVNTNKSKIQRYLTPRNIATAIIVIILLYSWLAVIIDTIRFS